MTNRTLRYFDRLITIDQIWLLVPLFLSFLLLSLSTLREGDLWWHLKVGEEILRLKSIPEVDYLSFTAFGEPFFFTRSWLSGLLLYIVFLLGGLQSLVLLQALVGLVVIGILMSLTLERGAKVRIASVAVVLSFLGLYSFSTARPVIFSYLCFSIFLWVIYIYRYKGRNRLWLLPIIMVLWVNLNSAWVTGLFLVGVFVILVFIETIFRRYSLLKIRSLLIWGVFTFLAIFINPLNIGILRDLSTATNNPVNISFVSEWQPTTILLPHAWPFYLILVLLIVILAYSKKPPDWIELILVLLFLALSFRYIRILPFFYIIVAPTLGIMGSELEINSMSFREKSARGEEGNQKQRKQQFNQLLVVGLLLSAFLSIPQIRLRLIGEPAIKLVDSYFPIGASEYLDQLPQEGIRLFSLTEWGGFLGWRHHPQMYVFNDGRVEQFPLSVWGDYYQIISAGNGWYELLRTYQVDYVVLSKEQLGRLISEVREAGLECPYEDSNSIVCSIQ